MIEQHGRMEFSADDREQLDNDVRCTGITFKIRGVAIALIPIRLIGIDMLRILYFNADLKLLYSLPLSSVYHREFIEET